MTEDIGMKNIDTKNIGVFRTEHDLVKIYGTGAKDFLQGQLSADMDDLEDEPGVEGAFNWRPSLLLSPEGKLVASLRVMRLSDAMLGTEPSPDPESQEYVLAVAAGYGQVVAKRLERFFIGAKCEMKLGSCSGAAIVWNKKRVEDSAFFDVDNPDKPLEALYPVMGENWSADVGCMRLLSVNAEMKLAMRDIGELPAYSESEFEYLRILSGVPKMGAELYEGLIPAEAGQKFIEENVSFTKGCFTGQELVARIDSRGAKTPRKLVGVVIEAGEDIGSPADYAELELTLKEAGGVGNQGAKEVGRLTSLARVPPSQMRTASNKAASIVGLAYVKRGLIEDPIEGGAPSTCVPVLVKYRGKELEGLISSLPLQF